MRLILPLLLLALTPACGKSAGPAAEPTAAEPKPETSAAPTSEAAADTSPEPTPEPKPEPKAGPILPGTYSGALLQPSAFAAAFGAWGDKEVVFAGHPMFFFDSDVLKASVNFNADPATSKDVKTALVGCTMKADETESLDKKQVLVMKGRIKGRFDKRIELTDCTRLAVLDAMPAAPAVIDPAALADDQPLPIKAFHDAFHGWAGKEVHFAAHFNGSTTSRNASGESIRIDLYDIGGGLMDKWISCYVDSAPTEAQSGSEKKWHIKGTATGNLSFDRPELEHCTFVAQLE